MTWVVLTFDEQSVVLPAGESTIGRAIDCRVRFNDPSISRRHLRITATASGVFVENLSSTNGTDLNGEPLVGARRLRDGDELRLGFRVLGVGLAQGELPEGVVPNAISVPGAREAAPGLLVDDDPGPDEQTQPGEDVAASVTEQLASAHFGDERTCPRCRASFSGFEDRCPRCGHVRPLGVASTETQRIEIRGLVRRTSPRLAVEVPVVYSSEYLTLDGVARDVSTGGMFIATELLDPIGTACRLTVLPDGHGALEFTGLVSHVATEPVGRRPPGLGIQFVHRSEHGNAWLERTLAAARGRLAGW